MLCHLLVVAQVLGCIMGDCCTAGKVQDYERGGCLHISCAGTGWGTHSLTKHHGNSSTTLAS